jgi:NarL family two-component system response regulator LiaR
MTSSVLLVDDHDIVRQGLAALLGTTGDLRIIGEAGDGRQAIEMARELAPDLIILDLLMPGMDGVTAIRPLRTVSPASKLAVLTSSEDNELAFAAIEAGAHAFLLKSMSGSELLHAIRRVVDDEVVIHPAITQAILKLVRRIRQPEANPYAGLSERELDVLRALAHGASNARLADTLSISVKTVKSHIGSILSKLHLTDRTEAVAFAWRHGLMQEQQPKAGRSE